MIKRCPKCNLETTEIEKYFYKHKRSKDGFKYICKKCQIKSNNIYLNTEHGFMMNLYNSVKKKVNGKRYKHSSEKEKDKHRCYVTYEEFMNLWEEHKKKFGFNCRLTNIRMVCLKAKGGKGVRYYGYSNGVSVDRLDPNIGYTKDNIIFIANEANKIKSGVTKDMCIRILKLYEEKGL